MKETIPVHLKSAFKKLVHKYHLHKVISCFVFYVRENKSYEYDEAFVADVNKAYEEYLRRQGADSE